MAGFKLPDFNDRMSASRDAKKRALEALRTKPALDPAVMAERAAAREAKEAAEAAKRAARREAIEQEKAAKIAAKEAAIAAEQAALAAKKAAEPRLPTAAELKAARDARYAARKARQRG